MPNRKVNTGDYRYGFNGKEDDRSWGMQNVQDYGFRLYNPSIGKFLSVDPLTKGYPWYTPYQFAGNKPIWAIDLDGLEEDTSTSWQDIVNGASAALNSPTVAELNASMQGSTDAMLNNTLLGIPDLTKTFLGVDPLDNYNTTAEKKAYLRGRIIGDAASIAQAVVEVEGGIAAAGGGLATGPGAAVISTTGVAVAFHGSGVGFFALKDLLASSQLLMALGDDPVDGSNWAKRPKFRKKTTNNAVNRAKDEKGKLGCTKCEKELTGKKQSNGKRDFQLGHKDGKEWAKQKDGYIKRAKKGDTPTRKEVNNNYQKNVEVECVNCNASHGGKFGSDRKKKK
jgi:RHS repeat-associated protein